MEIQLITLQDNVQTYLQKIAAQLNILKPIGPAWTTSMTYTTMVKKTIHTGEETLMTETLVFYPTDVENTTEVMKQRTQHRKDSNQ